MVNKMEFKTAPEGLHSESHENRSTKCGCWEEKTVIGFYTAVTVSGCDRGGTDKWITTQR